MLPGATQCHRHETTLLVLRIRDLARQPNALRNHETLHGLLIDFESIKMKDFFGAVVLKTYLLTLFRELE